MHEKDFSALRIGNRTVVPKEKFLVYAYLMYCEDRATHQCYPSYKTIGKAVGMSPNTVRKYVTGLVEKHLITTEPTSALTRDGHKRKHSQKPLCAVFPVPPLQKRANLR